MGFAIPNPKKFGAWSEEQVFVEQTVVEQRASLLPIASTIIESAPFLIRALRFAWHHLDFVRCSS